MFKYLFMSPSSITEDVDLSDEPSPSKCRKVVHPATHSNVAALSGLQSVTPCSIAYVAVQVRNIVFIVVYATDLCGTGGIVAFRRIQRQQLALGRWRIWSCRILQWDRQLFWGDTRSKGSGSCWQLTPMVEFVSQPNSVISHIWQLCRQVFGVRGGKSHQGAHANASISKMATQRHAWEGVPVAFDIEDWYLISCIIVFVFIQS